MKASYGHPQFYRLDSSLMPKEHYTFLLVLSPTFPGWYESRDMQAILTLMRRHTDPKVRMDLWRRAQVLFWEEVPTVKLGDGFFMHVHRPELKGYVGMPSHYFWNTWLEPRR